jgi:hypothetical protein
MDSKKYTCICEKTFTQHQSLYRHRKTCDEYKQSIHKEPDQVAILQEQLNVLQQKYNKLIDTQQLMQQQINTLQEQNNTLLQEQVKMLQSQLENHHVKQETPIINQKQETQPNLKTQPKHIKQNKKASVKSYLDTCKPVTFTDFMNNYIPTIEDYSNAIRYRANGGIVKNIVKYLLTHEKQNYPIIITNSQNARLRMLVYDIYDDVAQWKQYKLHDAMDFLESTANRFVNKLYKYKPTVFEIEYPGIKDLNHPERQSHLNMFCAFTVALRNSESFLNDIANTIKQDFCIIEDTDESDSE